MDTSARKLIAIRIANASISYVVNEAERVWKETYDKAMKWCDNRLIKEYNKQFPYYAPYWHFEDANWIVEHYTDNGYIDIEGNLVPYDAEGWNFEINQYN